MKFFSKTNIDFLTKRSTFFKLSISVIVLGIIGAFIAKPEFGIDFLGGTEVVVEFEGSDPGAETLRNTLDKSGFDGNEIKSFDKDNQYIIRVKEVDDAADKVVSTLNTELPSNKFKVIGNQSINAKIGGEMQTDAFIALILAVFGILIYIAFRFEFIYGLAAIIALVHDVIIAVIFVIIFNRTGLLNLEINSTMLPALLTVLGFSINDTVIIFDRIRENREKMKGVSLINIMNESINETLTRTINTTLTAVLALIPIVLFGGSSLEGFAFTMLVGFVVGTYSSIYIASAFVVWYQETFRKIKAS